MEKKKYESDITMDRALIQVHNDVKAGRAVRRLLEFVRNGEWEAVKDFLRSLHLPDTRASADVTDEQLVKLEAIAAKHYDACNIMYRRMGAVLMGKKLFSHAAFNPRSEASYSLQTAFDSKKSRTEGDVHLETLEKQQLAMLKFADLLFQHVVTAPGKDRLGLHGAICDPATSCPPHIAIEIFRQAAEAIAKLHNSNIVHGDIKAENFVLTDAGQVKLIDFGFLLEIDLLNQENFGPADVLNAVYIAPEMREIKQGHRGLGQLLEDGLVTSLGDLLKANDIWMLGQILYFLLCRPREVESSKFFAEEYSWDDQDIVWHIKSGLTADQATQRLVDLGLQSHLTERLRHLLFGKMLVPVQDRCKVAQELAETAAQLGKDMFQRGQAGLLQVVWPYFIPSAGINTHLLREKARGESAPKPGALKPATLFEPDVQYVKVTGGKLHWRVFEVGKGLETDGVELQIGDIIEKIDDKGPKECTTKRSGPYNSEIKLTIKGRGDGGAARELVLRRTRPVKRDAVAPDAERFRLHLVETGFWQRARTDDFDRRSLEGGLNRWRQQYRSEIDIETLIFAWRRRGWISSPAGPDQRATYHPRIRSIA
uniref:Protein kinase domain-containing protein n=1 Tax=Cryptomonas curvata TaxID=233186 RepID=A0A7S0QI48_9CRYP|mmetsp:Transcript_3894/g.8605  ORF Transcript_3894/g.8605 Transcript_3894/m.8605 type:complete len:596 (+) Transcript_3894:2718-4505(+)